MKRRKNLLSVCILSGATLLATMATGCGVSTAIDEVSGITEESHSSTVAETESGNDMAEVNTIMSLYPLSSADDAFADGDYSVSFTADDLTQTETGNYELSVEVFNYDKYNENDISIMQIGDFIEYCGKKVEITSIDTDDAGFIMINGGHYENGFDLRMDEGLYRTVVENDYPVYYSVGKVTLPLSEDITLEDHAMNDNPENDGIVYEGADAINAIQNTEQMFYNTNTVITVKDEQIVQIIRYWVP